MLDIWPFLKLYFQLQKWTDPFREKCSYDRYEMCASALLLNKHICPLTHLLQINIYFADKTQV